MKSADFDRWDHVFVLAIHFLEVCLFAGFSLVEIRGCVGWSYLTYILLKKTASELIAGTPFNEHECNACPSHACAAACIYFSCM